LAVDHPKRHQRALEFGQGAIEGDAVNAHAVIVAGSRVDDHRMIGLAFAAIDQGDPAIRLVQIEGGGFHLIPIAHPDIRIRGVRLHQEHGFVQRLERVDQRHRHDAFANPALAAATR
jgi:hypothetical protein